MNTDNGFTIIELMIVLAVAGLLMTVATPSFVELLQNNRLAIATNELIGEFALARSEAAKRGGRVIVCNSTNPSAATPACRPPCDPCDWTTGWIIFADGSTPPNNVYNVATDTLIKRNLGPSNNVTIASAGTATVNLRFNSDGSSENGGDATFSLCDPRGEDHGRQATISLLGRSSLTVGEPANPLPANSCL